MALNHVFSLTGMNLVSYTVVPRMFWNFETSCPPREVWPPDWNLSLTLWCLSWPPFEPFKLASDTHLAWKASFLLSLASAKRVSELHRPSFRVRHSGDWKSSTFSFLPKILLCLTLILKSSQFRPWMILWTVTGMNSCSAPSECLGGIFLSRSSIILISRGSSCPLV